MTIDKLISDPDVGLLCNHKPYQCDYVSLVRWYGENKMMPRDFNLRDYNDGFMLVHCGNHIYELVKMDHRHTINNDGSINSTFEGDRHELPFPVAVIKFNFDEWKTYCESYTNYWVWKKNRNKSRNELEEQFGYDCKHAMHLVRLLRMGIEALRDQEIVVHRPDAQELLDIRNGKWTYQEVVEYAEDMDRQVREVWYKKTELPKYPNVKFAAQLLMDVQDLIWNESKTKN